MHDEWLRQAKVLGGVCLCALCMCVLVNTVEEEGESVLMFMACSFYLASTVIHQLAGLLSGPKTTQLCSEDTEGANVCPACRCVFASVDTSKAYLPQICSDPLRCATDKKVKQGQPGKKKNQKKKQSYNRNIHKDKQELHCVDTNVWLVCVNSKWEWHLYLISFVAVVTVVANTALATWLMLPARRLVQATIKIPMFFVRYNVCS